MPPSESFQVIKGVDIKPINPRITLTAYFRKLAEETLVFGTTFGPHIGSIVAEISISEKATEEHKSDPENIAWLTATLLRLRNFEYLTCPICSNLPMSRLVEAKDGSLMVYPVEFGRGRLQPETDDAKEDLGEILDQQWIRYYLPVLINLNNEDQRFFFALHSYDASRFAEDVRFALAILWSGIESLFAKGGMEGSFKMGAAWASFLEPHGPGRNALRKEIAKLYNVRSKAVHGQPLEKLKPVDVLKRTRDLLRQTLCKLLEEERVPMVDELLDRLFE